MDLQKLSARELVQLCLVMNDEAWAEFVRRYGRVIGGVIARRVRRHTGFLPGPNLVDDLRQDTYVKIFANDFRALRNFDFRHENALGGYLKVAASSVVEDHFRRENPKPDEIDPDEIPPGPCDEAGPKFIERRVRLAEIDKCLKERKDEPNFARDYLIFWLYYRQGLTAKAIAELPSVGLSVKGVESTLLRMAGAVRAKLGVPPSKNLT
jgi:RNA polymerase sigma-70 factor, ECF subfamily